MATATATTAAVSPLPEPPVWDTASADAILARALAIIDQANAIRPTVRFDLLADLARNYHAAGDLAMLEHAITSGRRMLADLKLNESATRLVTG